MRTNFISEHLINQIKKMVKEKSKILDSGNNWFYFDETIKSSSPKSQMWFGELNRINLYNVYQKEKLLPVSWINIPGKDLIEIYQILKENKFYTYKNITGRSHKVRIKTRK